MALITDLCVNCGKEHDFATWGARCTCDSPNVVHQTKCNLCANIIGEISGDDHCANLKIICNECMELARGVANET